MKRAFLAILTTGCLTNSVSPAPTGDYTKWATLGPFTGELPGHGGATWRMIYANDVATSYEGGPYLDGTVLVKEIHELTSGNGEGALDYVAIMRRQGPPPTGFSDDGGWLFTYADAPGGSETHDSSCYAACHVAAPFGGAWFDYSQATPPP